MAKFVLYAGITGRAWSEVEAETAEGAMTKAFDAEWEIEEWDLHTSTYSGGYLDAEKIEDK